MPKFTKTSCRQEGSTMYNDDHPGSVFRCPGCGMGGLVFGQEETSCDHCGWHAPAFDGIPVLVPDLSAIEASIGEAKNAGRQGWYEDDQVEQLTGPWRHHVAKRRTYLECKFREILAERDDCDNMLALDLGCGDGINGSWLKGFFPKLWGSDYNAIRLSRASHSGNYAKIFLADATRYPVMDDCFDFIFFNHVLEHIPGDRRALAEVHRILKPGGTLVLGVPNEGAAFWQYAYRRQPEVLAVSDHVHFYTAEILEEKCREAEFFVREVHHIGWGIPHWSYDERLRKHKFFDDLFFVLGKFFFRRQATSLYLILTKR